MKGDPEQRAIQLGEYIAAHRTTVRAAAAVFGCSKSTVHKDVAVRLRTLQPAVEMTIRGLLDDGEELFPMTAVARNSVLRRIAGTE